MPYIRCACCGTEEKSSKLTKCKYCKAHSCEGCIEDNQCLQCAEAFTNGTANALHQLNIQLLDAISSPDPFTKRISRGMLKNAIETLED